MSVVRLLRERLVGLAVFCALGSTALAAEATPEKYLELLRSDVRTARVEILTEALDMSPAQADAFWPIYRQYETERSALEDRRIAGVKRFTEKYGTMSDADAAAFAKDWFTWRRDRLKLAEKYYGKVSKAVSSVLAAQFIQVESAVATLIDLQVAAELPLFE
jgi:hypothetical protein